jgi:hypothetical protein
MQTFVVIIMNDGGTQGAISNELVHSQIEVLNEDFRALLGTPGENGSDVMVQFCLAGIDRTIDSDYYDECYYNNCNRADGQNTNETYQNDLNVDPDHYLNIYTKRWPDRTGLLGYATWPWADAGQPRDGVAINWRNFGRNSPSGPPYDLGRTTTHEVGHYLGLLHTFQCTCCSAAESPDCYSEADLICDTNPEDTDHYGCTVTETCDSAERLTISCTSIISISN